MPVVICLVANKVDLRATAERSIPSVVRAHVSVTHHFSVIGIRAFVWGCAQRGAQLAEAHGAYYFETSAKDDIGVLCCVHAVLIL
jgi:hypothetical protein